MKDFSISVMSAVAQPYQRHYQENSVRFNFNLIFVACTKDQRMANRRILAYWPFSGPSSVSQTGHVCCSYTECFTIHLLIQQILNAMCNNWEKVNSTESENTLGTLLN